LSSSRARYDLRAGDVVVAVDGVPVELSSDLQAAIRARPPGTLFRLTIENGGATRTETVRSGSIPSLVQDAAALGVVISTRGFDIDLPFDVSFEERNVGGPSAGLAYSLAILDLLDPADLAEGRRIAATGTIDVGGRVGPIGGVDAKADSVKAAGADVFLVPETQLELVTIDGLDVRGVGDLGDARAVIERMQSAGA
jgi:Lon-like protease